MTDAFHPELRGIARILPRSVLSARTLKLHQVTNTIVSKLASKKVPVCGTGSVSVRLHRPASMEQPVPALLWIHGGGYIAGVAATEDKSCRDMADQLGIVVAAVDYRLAPQHRFPVALHDCYDALTWLSHQPFVDPARIAIGGASAGGGLAAALALLARERGEIPLRFQLLSYPMLDDRTALRTDIDQRNLRGWDNKSNAFGWTAYTGLPPGSDQIGALAAPSRCDDFSGLPPAWMGVGTLDLFHDEDVSYATALQSAGVSCQLHVVKGAFHGFDLVRRGATVSQAYRSSYVEALADALR